MTLDEFKKSVYHTEKSVVIPSLNRTKVDKFLFIKNGKWKPELLDIYLNEIYKRNYEK